MRWNTARKSDRSLTLASNEKTVRIEPVTDSIVRVVHTGGEVSEPSRSLMIESLPDRDAEWNIRKDEETLNVMTNSISLDVDRSTAAFTWRDRTGRRFVREPEAGGKSISAVSPAELAVGKSVSGPASSLDRTAYETRLELEFTDDESIYGLGQHEEGIGDYRGHAQHLYQTCTKVAMPAIVSTRGYGILWDTYSLASFRDDQHGSYFWTECSDQQEFYFVAGPELDEVVDGFRELTGDSTMFPRWAYGYLQSKEKYGNGEEIVSVVEEYRDRELPLDAIVQDWRYWPTDESDFSPIEQPSGADWGQWGQKSFDPERYPDPSAMLDRVHDLDAKFMISIWPNMHAGENREEMQEAGFVMDEENIVPGPVAEQGFYDAFDQDARDLYWEQAEDGLFSQGVDAWWCDSSEPYHADWDRETKPQPFQRVRINSDALKTVIDPEYGNAYSLVHSKGIYEGQRASTDKKRVVNLTRSGYPGQQRYGAITWSGDIDATWDRLEKQIADGLQFTATGNPNWTLDIGGFFADDSPSSWFKSGDYPAGCEDEGYRELYTRWFQFGTFLPMFRSHGTNTPREIWQFGDPGDRTYETLRAFDELRYRLLPYIYSLAGWETHERYTMFRHLAFDFREDGAVHDIADQFMFGPSLLVCPVTEPMYYESGSTPLSGTAKAREVYLPAGTGWYDFWTGKRYDGGQTVFADAPLEKIPVFVPSGSVLPMGPVIQHTGEGTDEPWEVRVYPGSDTTFELYEDAGDGYEYEDGNYATTPISWEEATGELVIRDRSGSFPELVEQRDIEAVVVGNGRGAGREPAEDTYTIPYDGSETRSRLPRSERT
jgi:alpha-D-xyloside xylohydrolase